jgi:hypothetical protein
MDELFELLTLSQTGKAPRIPVVLFDKSYWTDVINFNVFVEHGMIDAGDVELFSYADTAQEAWDHLVKRGLLAPYERKIT